MVNYSNGKIYKIEPVSGGEEGDVYIGSTTRLLCQRMVCHRSDYNRWKLEKDRMQLTSSILFEKYGIENCQITLLEAVEANSKEELIARERHYIQSLNCVNRVVPSRTLTEYYEDNKEYIADRQKKYNENNKEKIKINKQQYYIENREHFLEERKNYANNNVELMKERKKKYYGNNKDAILLYQKEYEKQNKERVAKYKHDWYLKNKEKQQTI